MVISNMVGTMIKVGTMESNAESERINAHRQEYEERSRRSFFNSTGLVVHRPIAKGKATGGAPPPLAVQPPAVQSDPARAASGTKAPSPPGGGIGSEASPKRDPSPPPSPVLCKKEAGTATRSLLKSSSGALRWVVKVMILVATAAALIAWNTTGPPVPKGTAAAHHKDVRAGQEVTEVTRAGDASLRAPFQKGQRDTLVENLFSYTSSLRDLHEKTITAHDVCRWYPSEANMMAGTVRTVWQKKTRNFAFQRIY